MSDLIASARSMTTVADNQYVAIGQPRGSFTPATLTAMIGIHKSDGSAIDLAGNVKLAMSNLQTVASSSDYPANVNAQAALNTLTTTQAKLFNKNDGGGFGQIVGQATAHIEDSKNLLNTKKFIAGTDYPDYGSGVKNFDDMADRGMTNVFGSLSDSGTALSSTGTLFNGINVKDLGTPGGIAQSFNNNKLANVTGLNQKMGANGVDLNNLTDPSYRDKIASALQSIDDPAAITTSAEQFEQANPFAGMPAYTGTDSSIYKQPSFSGQATAPAPARVETNPITGQRTYVTPPTTTGTSRQGGSFGSNQIEGQTGTGLQGLQDFQSGNYDMSGLETDQAAANEFLSSGGLDSAFGGLGQFGDSAPGIQNLGDLGNINKLADPSQIGGMTTDLEGLGKKLSDMGGGTMVDASKAPDFFAGIQKPDSPLMNSAHPTLNSLMTDSEVETEIENMIGLQAGETGFPSVRDILGPVGGNPELDALAEGVTDEKVTALNNSLTKSNGFIAAASLQASSGSPSQSLTNSATFATNLHKYGQDMSETGVGTMLMNMANSATKYGEGVKASLIEGQNNDLLAQNGIGPMQFNPFENTPSYTGTDGSLYTNPQVKMMGGG